MDFNPTVQLVAQFLTAATESGITPQLQMQALKIAQDTLSRAYYSSSIPNISFTNERNTNHDTDTNYHT
jgi:hypothetical protein